MSDRLMEAGLELRREMFGAEHAERALERATDFSLPMQELVTRYCFGEVWNRPELSRKVRSMLTLAVLVGAADTRGVEGARPGRTGERRDQGRDPRGAAARDGLLRRPGRRRRVSRRRGGAREAGLEPAAKP